MTINSSEEIEQIANRKTSDALKKEGDVLTKERPVDHWIYFKTPDDRGRFLSAVENEGFKEVKADTGLDKDYDPDYPHRLVITRMDKVDYESVDKFNLLWKLAKANNGDYDGWEAELVKVSMS